MPMVVQILHLQQVWLQCDSLSLHVIQNGNCGGDFVSYNGNTANKIIRLNTGSIDGTLFRFGI
jgi:hypothetical protein